MRIQPRKAKELVNKHITIKQLLEQFKEGVYPLFYNSYHPGKSFVTLPVSFLQKLADEAGRGDVTDAIAQAMDEIHKENQELRERLSETYHNRTSQAPTE